MLQLVLLIAWAVVIYQACEWFVDAVEWLGVQLKVGAVAVGTILAAVGTALPESVVTLVAVLFGSKTQGNDIAVGAEMRGPLVVGTVACRVTGAMLLWRRPTHAQEVVAGNAAGRPADPAADRPAQWEVITQTLLTLVVVLGASQLFVRQLEWAGPALGLSSVVLALLLSPIATELPEILNAIIGSVPANLPRRRQDLRRDDDPRHRPVWHRNPFHTVEIRRRAATRRAGHHGLRHPPAHPHAHQAQSRSRKSLLRKEGVRSTPPPSSASSGGFARRWPRPCADPVGRKPPHENSEAIHLRPSRLDLRS